EDSIRVIHVSGVQTCALPICFREDLFYRLNVLHIHMPALRERPEDIPAIARHVLHLYRAHKAPGVRDISEAALDAMRAWPWPGKIGRASCRGRVLLMHGCCHQ